MSRYGRADVAVRIRRRAVQVHVERTAIRTIAPVTATVSAVYSPIFLFYFKGTQTSLFPL